MEQSEEVRHEFAVAIAFIGPQEGIVTVYARDEEHAREIVREQFKNRSDLNIADVFNLDLQRAQLVADNPPASLN